MISSPLPFTCPSCGQIVGTGGGRCPSCGAQLPETSPMRMTSQPPQVSAVAPGVLLRREHEKRSTALAVMTLGGGVLVVAVLGAIGWSLIAGRGNTGAPASASAPRASASAPAAPTDPDDMGIADPAALDPSSIMPRAHARARIWDQNAMLVSIDATPVGAEGKVDLKSGGKVDISFAKPSGARLGPGAPAGGSQLVISVDASGSKVKEAQGPGATAVDDPNCPIAEAWRTMVAARVPSNSVVTMRYAYSAKHEKAVWQTSAGDDAKLARTLDGWTCTILKQ